MAATLQLTGQKEAYTPCDMDKDALIVYAVIACNPQTTTHAKFDAFMVFIEFLISDDIQDLLQDFGVSK